MHSYYFYSKNIKYEQAFRPEYPDPSAAFLCGL